MTENAENHSVSAAHSLSDETIAELDRLIAQASAGDANAWRRVFELSYELVRDRVRAILGHSFPRLVGAHDTTSVTNQLYLKLHRTLLGDGSADDASSGNSTLSDGTISEAPPAPADGAQSRRVSTLADYLRLIAWFTRNLLINLADRHDRRPRPMNDSDPVLAGKRDRASPGPDWEVSWRELHNQGVQRLADDERAVFEQHYYNGLSTAQIAAIEKVSERTVRRRWVAAMEKLGDYAMPLER